MASNVFNSISFLNLPIIQPLETRIFAQSFAVQPLRFGGKLLWSLQTGLVDLDLFRNNAITVLFQERVFGVILSWLAKRKPDRHNVYQMLDLPKHRVDFGYILHHGHRSILKRGKLVCILNTLNTVYLAADTQIAQDFLLPIWVSLCGLYSFDTKKFSRFNRSVNMVRFSVIKIELLFNIWFRLNLFL